MIPWGDTPKKPHFAYGLSHSLGKLSLRTVALAGGRGLGSDPVSPLAGFLKILSVLSGRASNPRFLQLAHADKALLGG